MADDRERLVTWPVDEDLMSPAAMARPHAAGTVRSMPTKQDLAAAGIFSLLDGWMPAAPVIHADTRVVALGSCFARYFVLWLAEHGFNTRLESSPHNALLRFGSDFESPASVAQQFRWAFGDLHGDALWVGRDKVVFEATETRRDLVRRMLQESDLVLMTLGLSEVWYDRVTGEPLWRRPGRAHYDPARHAFRVETMADTKRHLEAIEAIRQRHLPNLKIVFTVSPVRLSATFRPVSAVTANSASKAIIRAALDEFLREQGDRLHRELFYFPSYEIVHDFFRDPFEEDNRHVLPSIAREVVLTFARHYCDGAMLERATAPPRPTGQRGLDEFLTGHDALGRDVRGEEYPVRIAALEREVLSLQRACDERLALIRELDAAARERLALVERLHRECEVLREALAARDASVPCPPSRAPVSPDDSGA